jgi:hypothetical protein
MQRVNLVGLGVFTTLTVVGLAADRFEVSSIKAVRPRLVNTINALQKDDVAGARSAFDAYDSAWNGIEVYINTRSMEMYNELEKNYQARIAEGLKAPKPDIAKLLPDAKAMLAKYDEAIGMVEKAAPLNPLFDDVARLRIVRANLREMTPALKAGNIAKARKSFGAFDKQWNGIEHLIKARSGEADDAIEKGKIQIKQALMPDTPNVDEVTALVSGVMNKYNAVVADLTKDARAGK